MKRSPFPNSIGGKWTPDYIGWPKWGQIRFWGAVQIASSQKAIERYRGNTLALGYYGDSIVNSLADLAACAVGYRLAGWIPAWASVLGFFAVEALLVLWIRDSLLLNLLMLLWSVEAIKTWQSS